MVLRSMEEASTLVGWGIAADGRPAVLQGQTTRTRSAGLARHGRGRLRLPQAPHGASCRSTNRCNAERTAQCSTVQVQLPSNESRAPSAPDRPSGSGSAALGKRHKAHHAAWHSAVRLRAKYTMHAPAHPAGRAAQGLPPCRRRRRRGTSHLPGPLHPACTPGCSRTRPVVSGGRVERAVSRWLRSSEHVHAVALALALR